MNDDLHMRKQRETKLPGKSLDTTTIMSERPCWSRPLQPCAEARQCSTYMMTDRPVASLPRHVLPRSLFVTGMALAW